MSTEGFSPELSDSFAPHYDSQSSIVSDLIGGTVATVADFGASVWNSTAGFLGAEETSTQDLLARTSDNALRVYNEHPDAVQAASFVGGMFVPTGFALKGMGLLRSGTKGVNFFSEAGQVAQRTKVAEAFADAGLHSKQYSSALYGLYAMGAGNAVVDMAAMEASLLLTMNAHPFMEDYVKDPVKHFASSMLLGGAIGGGIAHIIDRGIVKGIRMGVETEALELAAKGYKPADMVENISGSIATRNNNIANWENILSNSKPLVGENGVALAGPPRVINGFTENLLTTFVMKEKAAVATDFERMLPESLRVGGKEALDEVTKAGMINMIASDPVRFAGIDHIRFASAKEDLPEVMAGIKGFVQTTSQKPTKLGQAPKDLEFPLAETKLKGKHAGEDKGVTLIYSKKFDAFMLSSDFKHYSTAVDLIQDEKQLLKGIESNWHRVPRYDFTLEASQSTTAFVDAEYLKALAYYDKLDAKAFKEAIIAVSPDDMPVLSAIYARIQKETLTNPSFAADLKVVLTKEAPKWDLTGTQVIEKLITRTITKTITQTAAGGTPTVTKGIDKNVLDNITKYIRGPGLTQHDLMQSGNSLSLSARELARSFSQDQMWPLHNGLEIFRRKNAIPQKLLSEEQAIKWGSDSYLKLRKQGLTHAKAMEQVGFETSNLGKYAEELVNSKETKSLKQALTKMGAVDSDGYTYLYRGMRGKAQGHSPGESYTPDYRVAMAFAGGNPANVSLYKVHLDEIVGHLGSFGGSKGGEAEIVLDVPTRIVAGKPQVIQGQTSSGHTITEVLTGEDIKTIVKQTAGKDESIVGTKEVLDQLLKAKQENAISLMQQGVPPETISLHTNIPLNTLKQFYAQGSSDLLATGMPVVNYGSASEIGHYLDVGNRGLAVSTELAKVPFAKVKAKLLANHADTIDGQVKGVMLAGSKSAITRDIGDYLLSDTVQAQLSVLRAELTRLSDASVGNKFGTSTDFALRDAGSAGMIASIMGKDVQELINRNVKALWDPMKPMFTTISKDPAATVELNTAMQVNAGIKGYRVWDGKRFLVQDENTPWKEITDAAGKVVGKERNMIPVEYRGSVFEVQTKSVQDALTAMSSAGREMYEMKSSVHGIMGRAPINDMGFWVPPLNVRNKVIAYVWDKVENKTTLLFGKNAEELDQAKRAFTSTLNPGDLGRRYEIIDKSNQKLFNQMQGRHDPVFMSSADISQFHKGSSQSEIISTNTDVLVDLANGYDHYVGYSIRSMLDMQLSDVMAQMDNISHLSQVGFKDQPLNAVQKMLQQPKDPGMIMRNTLLGNPNLDQNIFWQKLSDLTGGATEFALTTIADLTEPILNTGKSLLGKGKSASDDKFMKLVADMDARGIPNPFKDMDTALAMETFHVQQISQAPNMTPRILALSNATAATLMLRFAELAQPYVNAISLPILTSGAMTRRLEKSFMNNQLDPEAKFGLIKTMYNGIRYGGSLEGKTLVAEAEKMGIFKPIVSEATQTLSEARNLNPGIITKVEQGLESNFIQMMSKPADFSEVLVRRQSFLTGAYMAKEAYPGIDKAGQITFARNFMDQALGNYSAAQRPIAFQGTLGVAMGLFQTYMLTMAQQIYRQVETKNWKGFAKMMLAQETIFGARSLPGFQYVSEMIGEHYSDQNFDLSTGLYRATGDKMADLILYGLPSNLGPGITTRGEIQPRIPNPAMNGINAIPAFSILKQAYDGADKITHAAFTADASTGRAMLEAISTQSVSRPIARMSELLTGNAVTSKGNVIAGPDDVWTTRSVMARTFATRPMEEIKAREAIHLNTFYGSLDREARQKVTKALKTHMRNDSLTPEIVSKLGEEYMRTGSPSGWRSAINHATAQTVLPVNSTVRNYLKPNSPYQLMIEDTD